MLNTLDNPKQELRRARGGRGDLANTEESKKLDFNTKEAAKLAFEILTLKYPGLELRIAAEWIHPDTEGCIPDGGYWLNYGTLIATFEAKKQNDGGNGCNRYTKNLDVFNELNPFAANVLICSGEGTRGRIPKIGKKRAKSAGPLHKMGVHVLRRNLRQSKPKRKSYIFDEIISENKAEILPAFNVFNLCGSSVFLSEHGYDIDELKQMMVSCISKKIDSEVM